MLAQKKFITEHRLEWVEPSHEAVTLFVLVDGKVDHVDRVKWQDLDVTCVLINFDYGDLVSMEDCGTLSVAEYIRASCQPKSINVIERALSLIE